MIPRSRVRLRAALLVVALPLFGSLAACTGSPRAAAGDSAGARSATGAADTSAGARPLAVREGLSSPESVRYDSTQDVYFVGNWGNDDPGKADNNGYVSRVRPDGSFERERFIAGGAGGATLHAPRGMTITGDTLWVTDLDAVRGFDRRSGAPLASVSLARFDPGFLNDIAPGPDGALYLTDTGRNRVYRIARGAAAVALADSALGGPNGITWDAAGNRFVIVPFGGSHDILAWRPGTTALERAGTSTGSRYDGVEVVGGGRILVASQGDSSLHLFAGGRGRQAVRLAGGPADIAVDTRRNRVAVPFVGRNRVEIWAMPEE